MSYKRLFIAGALVTVIFAIYLIAFVWPRAVIGEWVFSSPWRSAAFFFAFFAAFAALMKILFDVVAGARRVR
jgi:hypothetical protein